jgi:hypothetical protein
VTTFGLVHGIAPFFRILARQEFASKRLSRRRSSRLLLLDATCGVAERDRVPSSRLNTAPTCIPWAIEAVALYHLEKISRESPKRLELGSKPVISSYARDKGSSNGS